MSRLLGSDANTKKGLIVGLALAVLFLGLDVGLDAIIPDSSVRQLLMLGACNVLVGVSLNVINGMAGQFSIGHAGFLALGAYSAAVVAANMHQALGHGDPSFEPTLARSFLVMPVALGVAALVSGFAGLLVGLPSLRLRGDYLAIVTLGFAEIVRLLVASAARSETGSTIENLLRKLGGVDGYMGPQNHGVPLYAGPLWVFGVVTLLFVVAWRLKFSGWGRALRALREDEIASAAVGVDPTRYKVTSFVISSMGAGVAGALMALNRDGSPTVQPENFAFKASFDAITMVILGGSGSVSGAAIGGIFITFTVKAIELVQGTSVVQSLRNDFPTLDLNAIRMVLYAALLVVLMILRPEGLLGERELTAVIREKWRARRAGKAVST